ncbi:MAG: hypothetical protein SCH71_14175 [Desulfobulbaceae bacterium]|nr:hypothetical protein [Desulfobulbaceae bacterium]
MLICQLIDFIIHFFARPKKRIKKMTPVPLGPSDCVALLEAAGILKTRFAQTVQNPLTATSPVLTKCQWERMLTAHLEEQLKPGFLNRIFYTIKIMRRGTEL